MDDDIKVALSLGAISVVFTWLYGSYLLYPISSFADSLITINYSYSIVSLVLMNLPAILLIESGSIIVWMLIDGNLHYTTSLASGLGYWSGYIFLGYWGPPVNVLTDGTIVQNTLGWSGAPDVVMAYLFRSLNIPSNQLYNWTYSIGPLVFLVIALLFGGVPVLIKIFAGAEAAEELGYP